MTGNLEKILDFGLNYREFFLGEISVPTWHSSDALLFSDWSTRVAAR
jgi:hypothetical protein